MDENKNGWDKVEYNIFRNYINKCQLFASNDELFNNFRMDSDYQKILEGGEIVVGDMAIHNIINKNKFNSLTQHLKEFKENDIYGNPILREYDKLGYISPTTLRYINTSFDVLHLMGNESPKTIIEVGGGYGGLCKTLSVLCDFDNYILVDQPEVIELCKKYISNFKNLENKVSFLTSFDNQVIDQCDLFISDSAFAECGIDYQNKYIDLYIKNSKYSYITYNTSHFNEFKTEVDNFKNRLTNKNINISSIDDKLLLTIAPL